MTDAEYLQYIFDIEDPESLDEMAVDTWREGRNAIGDKIYISLATGRSMPAKDFEMWIPCMTPSSKGCDKGGKHTWKVDYTSPFTTQVFESCKLCGTKKEVDNE